MVEILKKHKDYIIVYKPPGIPTQSDTTGDPDAMGLAGEMLKEQGEKGSLWLIHRLDRTVGGLLVFARNKGAAARLSELVVNRGICKHYYAVAEGVPEDGVYSDLIFKDSALGKAYIVDRERRGVKRAVLSLRTVATANGITLVEIKLETGRFHQIRAQLSHRGTPLVGDGKYGSRDKGARMPSLFAYKLAFEYDGEHVEIAKMPDTDVYPWSQFKEYLSGV